MGDLSLMRFPLWLALPLSNTSPRYMTSSQSVTVSKAHFGPLIYHWKPGKALTEGIFNMLTVHTEKMHREAFRLYATAAPR